MGVRIVEMGERLDGFAEAIMKGFTAGAERDRHLDDDLRALGERVTKLERGPRPRKPRKR